MYDTQIISRSQALCHLFFHCCLKDGRFSEEELKKVSEIFVEYGLEHELNFKKEIIIYRGYVGSIDSERSYIAHLVDAIKPVNELAIFSFCVELTLSDNDLSTEEEALLTIIAGALRVSREAGETIQKLFVQRNVVLREQIC